MHKSETQSSPAGMFTSCPSCAQQFRIQAAQLSMAAGVVKCGMCGHQFSALSRLSDAPLNPNDQNPNDQNISDQNLNDEKPHVETPDDLDADINNDEPEPEFDVPADKIEIAAIFRAIEDEESDVEEDQVGDDRQSVAVEQTSLGEPLSAEPLLNEDSDNKLSDEFMNDSGEEFTDDFPDELREQSPAKRSLLATLAWGLGALVLLIIIVSQLAWFNRDELLVRYPQLSPIARTICERLPCEILRHKDVGAIKLLNRDVRNHPLFAGNLLVNATMANQSETIQPFPLIQLALFDNLGEVIGYREFKPEEYLDDSINIQAGMQPESPIHFVLEVRNPAKEAVSFEFHFL